MRSLRKSLALLLALAMVLSAFAITTVSAQTFSDSSGHWADTWINKWSDKNVINGYEDGTFRPDNFITRAELAKIISTAKSYTALAEIAFTDVAGDEWYAADLKKCVAQGVIGGYEDGTFRPDEFITREEASAMFVRAYNINAIGMLNFVDNNDISEWSKTAVTALVGAGVINGYEDGTFLPKATITRAEVVKILDGVDSVVAAFPQATGSTGGTNTVSTIGNLGNSGGSSGSGSGSGQTTPNYKVTFDANGGKFSDGSNTDYLNVGRNGVIGSKAPQPVREGMIFDGWYTSAEAANGLVASKKWSINAAITRNMTLYAGWYVEGKIIVSFETCGGEPDVDSQAIERGSYATKPNVTLSREHYTFMGWYTEANGGKEVDFESTPINVDTCFYARWNVDAEYADQEVIIPSETIGSYQNGKIQAIPSSALPGETVTLNIIPPEGGYAIDKILSFTYKSTVEMEQAVDKNNNPIFDENGDPVMQAKNMSVSYKAAEAENTYTFVLPDDVENGTIEIKPHFVQILPTDPPIAPSTPTPTKDPNVTPEPPAPTEKPEITPTYYFTSPSFDGVMSLTAGVEFAGLTVSADSNIEDRSKTYNGSGYKYTKALRINKATLSFKVTGPCQIMVDAATPSDTARDYQVLAGSQVLGTFTCEVNAANTGTFNYTGSEATTITIKPLDGITMHGIFVDYNATPPSAEPTEKPEITPTYYFTSPSFDGVTSLTAGVEFAGLTVSADSNIEDRSKTYNGSGYKYTKALRINKAALSFKVTGPCQIMVDAATPSGTARDYQVLAGSQVLGTFTCEVNAANTGTFNYTGSEATTITIKPLDSITMHGIFVDYNASLPSAEPTEIPDTKHIISVDNSTANGSISVSNGTVTSDSLKTVTWSVDDLELDEGTFGAVGAALFPKGEPIYLNGTDSSDGYIVPYTDLSWYLYNDTIKYIRGESNGDSKIVVPITADYFNDKDQTVYRVFTPNDGQLSLDLYINSGKPFNLYDNATGLDETKEEARFIVNGETKAKEGIYNYTFACSAGHSYYFWANGSKAGVRNVAYTNGVLDAKEGDTVTITTKPDSGFMTSSIVTDPVVDVTETGENTYTLKMPSEPIKISAIFVNASASEYTATVQNTEHGTVTLEKVTVQTSAEEVTPTLELNDNTLTVFNGESIKINAVADENYEVSKIEVFDNSNMLVPVDNDNIFVMPESDVTVNVTFEEIKPADPPAGLAKITEEYTFIADDHTANGTTAIPAGTFMDNNRVYSEKLNDKQASNKKSSTINGEEHLNSLDLKLGSRYLTFMPGVDVTVTVYANCNGATRTLGVGTRADRYNTFVGELNATEFTFDVPANQIVFLSGLQTNDDGKSYVGGDIYIAGFTVKPKTN